MLLRWTCMGRQHRVWSPVCMAWMGRYCRRRHDVRMTQIVGVGYNTGRSRRVGQALMGWPAGVAWCLVHGFFLGVHAGSNRHIGRCL